MAQSYYWNIYQEYHPKNRLLKYSKSSKLSKETLQTLLQIRKTYRKLPPIIYSLENQEENQGINFLKTIDCIFPFQIFYSNMISLVNNAIYLYEA
jgi:hypothetical protein